MADFTFFLGDLNYRLNTTFNDLNNSNVKEEAIKAATTIDQFYISQKEGGNFPNYIEPEIKFLPSYKMSSEVSSYINKKNQAPSYCDRVLYKNNTSLEV